MAPQRVDTHRGTFGFTLIEMVVVISIIALLIAILLPALGQARQLAKQMQCASTIRQLMIADTVYAHDADGYYAPVFYGPQDDTRVAWLSNTMFRTLIGATSEQTFLWPEGYICPEATLAFDRAPHPWGWNMNHSYGKNFTGLDSPSVGMVWSSTFRGVREEEVKSPSGNMSFADATDWQVGEHASDEYLQYGEQYGPPSHAVAYRHLEGLNVAYFDGHASRLNQESVINTVARTQGNDQLWRFYEP